MAGSNSQIGGGESSSNAAALSSLSESERLKLLVESISDYAVYILGPDGAIASWNPGAEKITGYRAIEAVGQNFSLLFTDEDRGAGVPAQLLKEASLEGRSESECWLLRKDGGRFLASAVMYSRCPAPRVSRQALPWSLRDVTGRAAAQEAVLENERQFHLLVEGVVDYAIYHARSGRLDRQLERRRPPHHGLRSPRNRGPALFPVLHQGGPHGGPAVAGAGNRRA